MKKNSEDGRVQFGFQRNFLNLIISKLDKHVVLLPINYIASQSIQRKHLCPERKKPTVIARIA